MPLLEQSSQSASGTLFARATAAGAAGPRCGPVGQQLRAPGPLTGCGGAGAGGGRGLLLSVSQTWAFSEPSCPG